MEIKEILDMVKGFGSAAPVIGLLLWLYLRSDNRGAEKDKENKALQAEINQIYRDRNMADAASSKVLLAAIEKIGAK